MQKNIEFILINQTKNVIIPGITDIVNWLAESMDDDFMQKYS